MRLHTKILFLLVIIVYPQVARKKGIEFYFNAFIFHHLCLYKMYSNYTIRHVNYHPQI
jgi:hypothetical protein